jgi:SAM-dependent methyltransferase
MGHFPTARGEGNLALDVGCGDEEHRETCENAGFEYVGLDIASPGATILGDAHALPFLNESFEFVLSVAVLEHLRYPFLMTGEVFRVLQPGGRFVGTVAFLEPFHSNSFYHHTHMGTWNSLCHAGFRIERLSATPGWSVLHAQAGALFPRMPKRLARALVAPLLCVHRFWWKVGFWMTRAPGGSERYRRLSTAGSFFFVAVRDG